VDDKSDLAAPDRTTTPSGKVLSTVGGKWSYLQTSKFGANSQPYYVLLDPMTEQPLAPPQGANYDAAGYLKYLDSGLTAYNEKIKHHED